MSDARVTQMRKVKESTGRETFSLTDIISIVQDNLMAYAVWRLPDDEITHLIVCREVQKIKDEVVIEDLPPGFVFAPFSKNRDTLYITCDYYFSFHQHKLLPPNSSLQIASQEWLKEGAWKNIQNATPLHQTRSRLPKTENTQGIFKEMVSKAIHQIENGLFEKVVLSRPKRINLPNNFDSIDVFQKLNETYPTALIYYTQIPETGSWMGATPECLVRVEDNSIFRTTALAGTQPFYTGMDTRSVAWTQKEIEEHALVERYIISCFKKIRLREYEEYGPKTVIAGNLMHLRSDFTVDLKTTNFPQLGTVMLNLLHPTSAVCGSPLETSLNFINENEGYDRTFYTGYLGPINMNNNTDIFVNLRCMQILDQEAILYAGAGITCDSTPEKEWEETEMKLNTLLTVIE